MWAPQLLGVLRSLSPSSRSTFAVESLKSATRNFEKLLDILEFLLTHDLKFASTNFYIENGHVERRIKPLRAGHTSKEIQKNLSQTAGLGYRHAAALNQLWAKLIGKAQPPRNSTRWLCFFIRQLHSFWWRRCAMKAQELVISCFYDNDGESIRDLLYSSFAAFLKRELGKFAPAQDHPVW